MQESAVPENGAARIDSAESCQEFGTTIIESGNLYTSIKILACTSSVHFISRQETHCHMPDARSGASRLYGICTVMDKPDLVVVAVIGDGEAESGRTATYVSSPSTEHDVDVFPVRGMDTIH